MNPIAQLQKADLKHIWHPASHMKDFETNPPLIVESAKGSYLYTHQGPIIDGISSWWCKSLGHGHPAVLHAITQQLQRFEHVIAANTTHPLLVELGELLTEITQKDHVFFASDGSSAVEIAMKLALQANLIQGTPHKNQFIALKNAYHGETLGALSVSELGVYKTPFENTGVTCHFIEDIPYVSGKEDENWLSSDAIWQKTLAKLEPFAKNACALILEPIVQGASGMLVYSADFLKKLADWAKANNIYLIADEIMTGLGRTGEWLACQHAKVDADIICLSKGLTSGSIPLSCVMIDTSIYTLFYDDYDKGKSFLHSHTYSGNALAVSAAVATLKTMQNENILKKVEVLHECMLHHFTQIAESTGALKNIRSLGAIVAGEISNIHSSRVGYAFHKEALQFGALLRPIGNTLYWLPPLIADENTIQKLAESTKGAIQALQAKSSSQVFSSVEDTIA